ncbi:EF-hand domain-containing protein [Endozoicomonadaceae bacterium StTr2]
MNSAIENILHDDQKLLEVTKVAFDSVDVDGSGFIDKTELRTMMTQIARDANLPEPSSSDAQEVLDHLDQSGDAKLSLHEFKVLVKQMLEVMNSQG